MNRDRYIEAYRRIQAWQRRQSSILREEILVPYFCGMDNMRHNMILSVGTRSQWSEWTPAHSQKSREYDYRQRIIWDTTERLGSAFAEHF
jgi:hypothetical protein